jgi:hypothetical protein
MSDIKRREFMSSLAGSGVAFQVPSAEGAAPQYNGRPELKITDIQATIVNAGRNYVYVKVSTDAGIHGWGGSIFGGPG